MGGKNVYDPVLGELRKQYFTETDIKMIAESVIGTPVQEVISVATYADLEAIENPSTEAIYIVTSNNSLYRYNGSGFIAITGEVIDNTIYVSSLNALLSMTLENASVYRVLHATQSVNTYDITLGSYRPGHTAGGWQNQQVRKYYATPLTYDEAYALLMACTDANPIHLYGVPEDVKNIMADIHNVTVDETYVGEYTFESYSLSVNQTGEKTLVGRKGWATVANDRWAWENYAMEEALQEILDELAGKQPTLVSGTNIKTVNGQSLLGTGNIDIAQSVVENVIIKLTAPTAVDWTQLTVLVQNISTGTSTQLALSANGECSTNIPMGNLYEITLPSVGQYTDPLPVTYTAIGATRNIQHNYSYDAVGTELVKIQAHVAHPTATVASLSGLTAYATDTNSNVYSGTFNASGYCEISIPYGKSYTLTMPELQGLVHDHNADHHVSGVPARNVLIHYTEMPIGCFGIDANGKHYTAAEIAELPDKDIIVFVGYNDLQLATMDRGDGTHGCGIMWKVASEVASKSWANQNIEFDHNRLPYVASEAAAINAPCSGRLYTETILEILEDMQTDSQNPNPTLTAEAAAYCASKTAQCGGVDLQGFMGNFFEYKWPFVTNKTLIQEVYTALGKTAPSVWSGYWWTSCQYSAQGAVLLSYGSFDYCSSKTFSNSVLPLYDLIIKS